MSMEEGVLIELLASQPGGDLTVVLARVAGRAGRNDVPERVAAAMGDRLNAVALHRDIRGLAIGAPSPGCTDGSPLLGREIVLDASQPSLPALGVPLAS